MRQIHLAPSGCAALLLAALLQLSACGGGAPPGGMPPGNFTPQVTVVTLKAQSVTLTRELPGRTNPYLVAEVRPQVSGIVKKRLFTEGALVQAGQPLYELDDAIYRAQLDSAQASLSKAQATLAAAKLAADRSRELIKTDAVSAQDNDNAIAAFGQAQADVSGAKAAVANAAVNLAYAHLVAPISGRIGKSAVTQGALVTADQTAAMATVQTLDPIYVDVNQASSEWLKLKQEIDSGRAQSGAAESPVKIVLADGRTYAHTGRLQFADVTVDPTTGDFSLRAIVPNPNGELLPGMYVRAIVDEGVLPQGVLAPQQGILRDPKGNASALVVSAQGKVEPRAVKVTRTIGDQWLIDEGLAAGDRLIVEGLQKVQPGMAVKAIEASEGVAGTPATAEPDAKAGSVAPAAHSSASSAAAH
ncbi:MAG TPA: efflux RND transporter periplasmic adaptor subunit [Steroidobacteraceae bacterium]|nr:efflux RND transporter periplasmic adaptor subunit [Steroidobacteraceae bacterium]